MKYLSYSLLLLFSLIYKVNAQNSLIIKDLEAGPGDLAKIVVDLENKDKVSGFQFKIKLPTDVIVKEKEVKFLGRNTDHVVYPKNSGNGEYLFLCFSGTNDNFTGENGGLIEIPVELPLTYTPGQTYAMTFTEAIVSSASGQDIGSNHKNGTLKITEGKNPDLEVSAVTFLQPDILPNSTSTVKWNVTNIGKASATGGWKEQISLVSQTNGKKYIIGYSWYTSPLKENDVISREEQVDVPAIIGFDGNVKIEVALITNSAVREPSTAKGNNTTLSTNNVNLLKRLTLTIDRKEITENSTDKIKVTLARSGDLNSDETFNITTDGDNRLDFTSNVTIHKNESANFLYIKPVNNTTYEGDKKINVAVKGNSYSDEQTNFNLQDDEKVVLLLTYPPDYSSAVGSKIQFTLQASFSKSTDQVINLSCDRAKRLQLPAQVTLPATAQTVTFDAIVTDTKEMERAGIVTVVAKSEGFVTADKDLKLNSINVPKFSLSINPGKVSEGDGIKACVATLKRSDQLDKQAILRITASKADQLIFPSEIVFEKGQSEKTFDIGTVNNSQAEGDRIITVKSQARFSDCMCVDEQDSTSTAKQNLTLIDNDGLALTVAISPSTTKAGSTNNKLTISRNTDNTSILQNPVTVSLSNDAPSIIELPATVTIPENKKSIEIAFSTKIDPNVKGDKNVRIQADAQNYSSGFGWMLISDQNKPDAIVTKVETQTSIEAGKKINVKTFIQNQGNSNLPSGCKINYYLSKSSSPQSVKPFTSSFINKSLASGETYEYSEEIQLPSVSGNMYLITKLNPDNLINELNSDNNENYSLIQVLPAYQVTITLDKEIYKGGEPVTITGTTKTANGAFVPNSDISLTVKNQEYERNYTIKSDANGGFTFVYTPLDNESGSYAVSAAFPGETVTPQKNFQLLGFEIINKPMYIKWEPAVNTPLGQEFKLKNKTGIKLTGVRIEVPADAGFTIDQQPMDIDAGATVNFPFKLVSVIASQEFKYYNVKMTISSTEGASYHELIYYYGRNQFAKLEATPVSINTTMVKDQSRIYEFTVKNIGSVDAENVEVLLPEAGWIKLNSAKVIDRIKSNEEAKIALELKPTVKEQVNAPITGTFVIKQKQGGSLTIPYSITTVSESTGKLIIDATDEYTYNTILAPHLKGAKVVIKQPYSGTVVAEGLTDEYGLFEVAKIPEGWYTVTVSADKHNPYQNNIQVDPGKDTRATAFLPYQAVTYSWEVKPTDIKDEYDVKLDVKFETNVPKPVVVMEIDDPILNLKKGESRLSYVTITNHGLIAGNKVSIGTGTLKGYSLKPLITSLDVLNAKSSVIIPVLIKNDSSESMVSRVDNDDDDDGDGDECTVYIYVRLAYLCNLENEIFSYGNYKKFDCDGDPITSPIDYLGPSLPGQDPMEVKNIHNDQPTKNVGTVTGINLCDPCTNSFISACLSCTSIFIPELMPFSCAFGILTSSNFKELIVNATLCLPTIEVTSKFKINFSKIGCFYYGVKTITDCFMKKNSNGLINEAPQGNWVFIRDDLKAIIDADSAHWDMLSEYHKNNTLEKDSTDFILFLKQTASHIDNETAFTTSDIATIKTNLKNTSITSSYIDSYTKRWNTSIEAWKKGIFSPTPQYPTIVDKERITRDKKIKADLKTRAFTRGFISVEEMFLSDRQIILDYINSLLNTHSGGLVNDNTTAREAASIPPVTVASGGSVCASVTIEFPQKITMTRQAFEGTLKINNSSVKTIKDINLDIRIKDENGENKTHLFQVNKATFLSGTGEVVPNSNGSGTVIFIPTKEAAPEVKKSYSFGGTLSYFDPEINQRVSTVLNPVTLEVNPSPDLVLHYFMQRDILGDDALTEDVIEPSLPAELSLLINNEGYGAARNVNVESAQPKIIDNEKGLLVDFNMTDSRFNNQPKQLGLLNVDFGTIEPKKSAIGQWFFTSSLLGHFVKYDVKVTHKSNYGNENLSLIKAAYIHELIKSVRAYDANSDAIDDFLVNDLADAYDTPDHIFLSNGSSEEVAKAQSVEALNQVSSASLTAKIKIIPLTSGWNYANISDPGGNRYKLTRVVRDHDHREIPLVNFWQTAVTLKDGLNPKYENKLHMLDNISQVETYTLYFNPIDGNIPEVEAFVNPPEKNTPKPVEVVNVKFNKEIDVNTFTTANIELISQGNKLLVDKILIGKIDATTYSINIAAVTKTSGYYQLQVNTLGIKDLLGNEGKNGKKIEWIQFINELGILKFESDQVKKNPVNSIQLVFNKPIRTEEFTTDKLTINNVVANNLTIQKTDDYNYTISGISSFNKTNGEYSLGVDASKITAVDGTKGLAIHTCDWKVDKTLPKIVNLLPLSQAALNNQNITEIDIELNRKLASKPEASSIQITKDGQKLNIPLAINQIDELNYKLTGLGSYTLTNGKYKVSIDQSVLKDENNNFGEGMAEASWVVKLAALTAVSDVSLSPDRGFSDSDNITSGNDVQLIYKTLEDSLNIEVYQVRATSDVLIDKQFRDQKGEFHIPLTGIAGAQKFKIVGSDKNGNSSNAVFLSAYIDFAELLTQIEPVDEIENDCRDFDYVNIIFSDDIDKHTFTTNTITLKSKGMIIPKGKLAIKKVSDKKYILDSIANSIDGTLTLEIDKAKIAKKLSGLTGVATEGMEIGNPAKYKANISGEKNPAVNGTYTYTATSNLNKYDWVVTNGEFVSSASNTVNVKWKRAGSQSLTLRFLTPLNCILTETKEIAVMDTNAAPSVSITSPATGTSVITGTSVSITATASSAGGTVASVEFFVDGISIGLDTASPYQASYSAITGTHTIFAKATDNKGNHGSDSVSIQVINHTDQSYSIQTVTGVCTDPSFCLPVLAIDSVKNVIGYDLVLNYDPAKVHATGTVLFNNALINPAYISYAVKDDAISGKITISVYLNTSAPANSSFNGTGQLLCVEFSKDPALPAVDTVLFQAPFLQESYTIGVASKSVNDGKYINTKSMTYHASLKFWTNNSPIKYNSANPAQYLITNMYGTDASCANKSATAVQPDTSGLFSYNLQNGTHLSIERDIASATDVQPVINGFDASLGHKVLLNDLGFKPSIFQMIAMDVNADGIISAGDISQINQRSVKTILEFKQKWNYNNNGTSNGLPSKDWLFLDSTLLANPACKISSTYPLSDGVGYSKANVPVVPFCLALPASGTGTCPVYPSSAYKGVLLGDINGNYDAIAADGHLKKEAEMDGTIYINLDQAVLGAGYIDLPISIVSPTEITSLDFALQFNEQTLSFDKIVSSASYLTDVMANYSKDDKTLRFTSNSIQLYETDKTIVAIRFNRITDAIGNKDLFNFSGYLNGDKADMQLKGSIITGGISANDKMNNLIVYPNPAYERIHVISPERAMVELMDLQSRNVIVPIMINAGQKQEISTENIAAGMYLLKVCNEHFVYTQRIVIENIR